MTPLERLTATWLPYLGPEWAEERARNFANGWPQAQLEGWDLVGTMNYYLASGLKCGMGDSWEHSWDTTEEALEALSVIGAAAWRNR